MKGKDLTLIVQIQAKKEHGDLVKAALIALASQTRLESGNIFYILHESTSRPNLFLIYERWADQDALDLHMKQGYLQTFLKNSQQWLSNEIEGIFCREVQ